MFVKLWTEVTQGNKAAHVSQLEIPKLDPVFDVIKLFLEEIWKI